MCDAECQAEFVAKSKEEAAELENIVLLVTFFLLVTIVFQEPMKQRTVTEIQFTIVYDRNQVSGTPTKVQHIRAEFFFLKPNLQTSILKFSISCWNISFYQLENKPRYSKISKLLKFSLKFDFKGPFMMEKIPNTSGT